MSTTIMQSLTFIKFVVSQKIATLKFLPRWTIIHPASRTLIITQTHIFHANKKRVTNKPPPYSVQRPCCQAVVAWPVRCTHPPTAAGIQCHHDLCGPVWHPPTDWLYFHSLMTQQANMSQCPLIYHIMGMN